MQAAVTANIGDRVTRAHMEPSMSKSRFRAMVVPMTKFHVNRLERARSVRLALPDGVAALAQ